MTTTQPMQENAWNEIKNVTWAAGKDSCDECGAGLAQLKGVKLEEGRQRYHCVSCMQRYNVRWSYADFGLFG